MCATLTKPFNEAAAAKLREALDLQQKYRKPRVPKDADFARLITGTRGKLNKLADRFANGILDGRGYIDALFGVLTGAHAEAVTLGRHLAGDLTPQEIDDELFAELVMQGESTYLARFLNDLQVGRYIDADGNILIAQIKARATMYSGKLRGTANEVFVLSSPVDASFAWHQLTAEPCDDCPRIEAGGPYTSEELSVIGHPGQGKQQCLTHCGCVLVRLADGVFGFSRSYD